MGNAKIVCSLDQFKVLLVIRLPQVLIKVEGLQTYACFEVINIFDETNTYLSPLAINRSIENQIIIKFKKKIMSSEYSEMRVVQPLDTIEEQKYVEPVRGEYHDGDLDNIHNISSFLFRDFFDLSKHNISTVNSIFSYKIPNLISFHTIFIANKYTLLSFVIQLSPFLLWNMYISITTKNFQMLNRGFLTSPYLLWCFINQC